MGITTIDWLEEEDEDNWRGMLLSVGQMQGVPLIAFGMGCYRLSADLMMDYWDGDDNSWIMRVGQSYDSAICNNDPQLMAVASWVATRFVETLPIVHVIKNSNVVKSATLAAFNVSILTLSERDEVAARTLSKEVHKYLNGTTEEAVKPADKPN